ncbi:hypothetical protein Prum_071420 [Phytohabitans rumicis]|uniref:Uncharacterized protein n=1 Tax=Phytohabitans rumicis TaxID=1076125 RepID=A0A6V8LCW8_9ACTN|nr:hypothetical protein Prum_071420 [Phytohabitans rumicis]
MADRAGGPGEEAKRILEHAARPTRWQKINEARSRLAKLPPGKVPADARLLIDRWHELALDLAEQLRQERQSAREKLRRQQEKVGSRLRRAFFWGLVLGAAIVGSVALFLRLKQP